MASGANGRGLVQRVKDARRAYRGPFSGLDIEQVVRDAGYLPAFEEEEAFLIFRKAGCKPIPVNPEWREIWDDDPIFRCLQRDLKISRAKLCIRLNQARRDAR